MKYKELVEAKAKNVKVHTHDGVGWLNGLGIAYSYISFPDTDRIREYNNTQIAVVISTRAQAEPMCPACGGALRGNVVETFGDVSLSVDAQNNICWDTWDADQVDNTLMSMACNECGYEVPSDCEVV